ncbi:MAG: flagellar biosynthesis protein FlhA [Acidobacteriota bacterium]
MADGHVARRTSQIARLVGPVVILAALGLMIVPLPPFLLDLLLSIDIGLSAVFLLTAIYVRRPTEFSAFPSVLLLLTLMRLSLNVAGTRLILLHGAERLDAAGQVIMAFGQFVVGANFAVGIVVFLVLVTIQFLVINHGSVRISEVTARFTLDAMPGRQMAIDADLSAGIIDEHEARRRREQLRGEADFYGSMDGAIRFTQRDAVAALLITGINIVAGLALGVLQHGLDLATAARTFTILTVGEGLVTAVPGLLVSMSAALVTTRATTGSELGEDVAHQLLSGVRPLAVAAVALVGLALVPGLPKVPFLLIAGLLGAASLLNHSRGDKTTSDEVAPPIASDSLEAQVAVDPVSVEVGYALVAIADEQQGGTLLSRVRAIRRQIASETGVVAPPVRVADNLQLAPRAYAILIKGVEVARGELYPDRLLAIDPGSATASLDGISMPEPAFGLPACWIVPEHRDRASAAGFTVVDATTALSTHLSETIRAFLPDLLSRQQVKDMVDRLAQAAPRLVDDVVPKILSLADIQRVLRQLLRERVPVKDLATILETVADVATATKDTDALVETARAGIGRAICRQYQNDRGELPTIALAPGLEERLLSSLAKTDHGLVLALDPKEAKNLATRIAQVVETAMAQPVLLCSAGLRPHLWRMFSRVLPHFGVLAHTEVPAHVKIAPVAVLD